MPQYIFLLGDEGVAGQGEQQGMVGMVQQWFSSYNRVVHYVLSSFSLSYIVLVKHLGSNKGSQKPLTSSIK